MATGMGPAPSEGFLGAWLLQQGAGPTWADGPLGHQAKRATDTISPAGTRAAFIPRTGRAEAPSATIPARCARAQGRGQVRSPEGARGRPSRSQSQERKRPEAGSRPRGPWSVFTRRTAPPHILPPARQRGPCQPRAAGLRHQAHPEVHWGGQGHGEESEPVPSSVYAQLPRGAAPGGHQNHAVENQIGEEGWEDGPGVPVGLEQDPRNETKQREILCDLALLVGAVKGAQSQESQECWAGQLKQLYRHAEFFLRLLQTWEEEPWEPGCSPGSKEINTAVIFLAYQRLLQGKLRFFFHDLAKDLCDRGQGGGRDPPAGPEAAWGAQH
ncbi:thrombopoietin isoform X2 [Anser cygnoides]|uniref:thrombopoietin isoform X2 n=1 Tax=Anser cygnoides TaxID=8845 RepID=UPI0034D1E13B